MFSLFARALAYANLTPLERSILRFLEAAALGALVAGLQAALPLLTDASLADPSTIAWASVAHTFIAALLVSLGLAVRKFMAAQADPPVPPRSASLTAAQASSMAAATSSAAAIAALSSSVVSAPASPTVAAAVSASVPDGVL